MSRNRVKRVSVSATRPPITCFCTMSLKWEGTALHTCSLQNTFSTFFCRQHLHYFWHIVTELGFVCKTVVFHSETAGEQVKCISFLFPSVPLFHFSFCRKQTECLERQCIPHLQHLNRTDMYTGCHRLQDCPAHPWVAHPTVQQGTTQQPPVSFSWPQISLDLSDWSQWCIIHRLPPSGTSAHSATWALTLSKIYSRRKGQNITRVHRPSEELVQFKGLLDYLFDQRVTFC